MAGNPVQREVVEALYAAYAVRDAARIAEFLYDNVAWTISGRVDVLSFCGTRHGKAAVLDLIERRVPEVFSVFSFVPHTMLIEGDRVATLNRLSARRADDGRGISYRLAHFIRFRGDKIVSTLSLIDSYDAVEQVLGHSLAGPAGMPERDKNVVAVKREGRAPMGYQVPRSLVEAFYELYATRHADRIVLYLHDDVRWTISGPIDYLAFCGTHRGKAAVFDVFKRQIPLVLRTCRFVPESIVVDGDRAAMLSRQSSQRAADGRAICFRGANFMRFRDDKVVENVSLIDLFDAGEQVIGRPLAVHEDELYNDVIEL